MLPFTSESSLVEERIRSLRESPPVIRYVRGPRHFSFTDVLRRLRGEYIEYYTPPPPPNDKKTIVLDLDETLIHSSSFPPHRRVEAFTSGSPQFYVFKRPGLDDFLKFVRQNFEVFIFTYAEECYAKPIIDRLMPWLDDQHRLYRDACDGRRGPEKDLGIFGRSKKNLILIDDCESAMSTNPQNTLLVPRWCGTPIDRELIDRLPQILEKCLAANDVREVIKEHGISPEPRDTCDGIPVYL
jgi:Dullard-like phosphatase family protein